MPVYKVRMTDFGVSSQETKIDSDIGPVSEENSG
jgi:hypothetical protein